MRLTLKLAAVWISLMMLVLSAMAWFHARRLFELQERDLVNDQQILARALAPALREMWRTSGQARALEYAELADARRQNTTIDITPLEDGLVVPPEEADELITEVVDDAVLTETIILTPDGPWRLVVRRDTRARRTDIQSLFVRDGVLFGVLVLLAGALATWLGHFVVGRRTGELHEAVLARSRGETLRVDDSGRDELSELAAAFNHMTASLASAESRIADERRRRARALNQLRHSDRLAAVGRIGSSMAHEIATPLNVISGYAQMLPDMDEESERAEVKDLIVGQAGRISDHLRALLDYSRRNKVEMTATKPGDCLNEIRLLLAPLLDDHGIKLTLGAVTDISFIGAQQLVAEVLTNLVTNAMKFMPDGGTIEVAAHYWQDVSSPPAFRAGPHVVFAVKDEGPGMDEATRRRVFEPFYTTNDKGGGTGLGLSICMDILDEHEGYLDVDSAPGEGSTFYAGFPVEARQEQTA